MKAERFERNEISKNKEISKVSEKIYSEKNQRIVLSFIWIVFCILAFVYIGKKGHIENQANDEVYLNVITAGLFGKTYAFNVFNNIILSGFSALVNSIFPSFNCLGFVTVITIVVSYVLMGLWSVNYRKPLTGFITALVIFAATNVSMLGSINFSKTGGFVMSVGAIFLIESIDGEKWRSKKHIILRIIGLLLLFIGSLYRLHTTIAFIPFLAVLVIYVFIKNQKEIKRLIPVGGILIAIFLAWICNTLVYNLNAEWKYFFDYNEVRAEIYDYEYLNTSAGKNLFDVHKEELEAIGIGEIEFEMLRMYNYADDEVFSLETMTALRDILVDDNASKFSLYNMKNGLRRFFECLNEVKMFYTLMLLSVFAVSIRDKKRFIGSALIVILGLAELYYLCLGGRTVIHVITLCLIPSILLIQYFLNDESVASKNTMAYKEPLILAIILAFSCYYNGNYELTKNVGSDSKVRENYIALEYELASHQDNLYLWPILLHDDIHDVYGPLSKIDTGIQSNSMTLGGWIVPSPIMTSSLEKFGERYNALKLLGTNLNVYLVVEEGTDCKVYTAYLNKYYNVSASARVVDTLYGYDIVSFVQ